jgi:hypothetical protein
VAKVNLQKVHCSVALALASACAIPASQAAHRALRACPDTTRQAAGPSTAPRCNRTDRSTAVPQQASRGSGVSRLSCVHPS